MMFIESAFITMIITKCTIKIERERVRGEEDMGKMSYVWIYRNRYGTINEQKWIWQYANWFNTEPSPDIYIILEMYTTHICTRSWYNLNEGNPEHFLFHCWHQNGSLFEFNCCLFRLFDSTKTNQYELFAFACL